MKNAELFKELDELNAAIPYISKKILTATGDELRHLTIATRTMRNRVLKILDKLEINIENEK